MATIGRLNYQITANTSGFTKGVIATRKELSDAKKLMRDTRTPAEQIGTAIADAGKLASKGAIDYETYGRAIAKQINTLKDAEDQMSVYNQTVHRLNKELAKGVIDQTQYDDALKGIDDSMTVVAKTARDTTGAVGSVNKAMDKPPAKNGLSKGVGNLKDEMLGGIPGVSQFTSALGAIPPQAYAVLAALAVVVVAVKKLADVVRAFVGETIEQFAEIDKIAKTSRKIDVDFSDLIGLQMVASEFAGFTDDQTNMALQRMRRRIAEAAKGMGEAQGALRDLGLDAAELSRLPLPEQFKRIADAMQRVEDGGERLRLAFKLFDSEGAGLVNALVAGRAAIEDVEQAAGDLWLTLSDAEVAGIEQMNDSIARAQAMWSGMARQFAAEIAPLVTVVAQDLIEMFKKGSAAGELLRMTLKIIPPTLALIVDLIQIGIGASQLFAAAILRIGEAAIKTAVLIDNLREKVGNLIPTGAALNGVFKAFGGDEAAASIRQAADEFESFRRQFGADGRERFVDGLGFGTLDRMQRMREQLMFGADKPNLFDDAADTEAATALQTQVDTLTESLQKQIATFGMSADQVARWELAQAGASQETLAQTKAMQEQLQQMKQWAEAAAAGDELIRSLEQQRDAIGMTADQLQIEEARRKGVREGILQEAQLIQEQIAAKQQHQALMDDGLKLMESLMTAEERFLKQRDEIQLLKDVGAIGEDTYQRALAKIKKELDEANGKKQELAKPVQIRIGAETALKDTQAAFAAIARHRAEALAAKPILPPGPIGNDGAEAARHPAPRATPPEAQPREELLRAVLAELQKGNNTAGKSEQHLQAIKTHGDADEREVVVEHNL